MTSKRCQFLLFLALISACLGQSPSADPSTLEGRQILRITVPRWADGTDLPIKVGQRYSTAELDKCKKALMAQLQNLKPLYSLPFTLDVSYFLSEISPLKDGVWIRFTVKRLVLTEDDTPGRAIDEASAWTPSDVQTASELFFDPFMDYRRDKKLGDAFGASLATSQRFAPSGFAFVPYVSAWLAPRTHYSVLRSDILFAFGNGPVLKRLTCGPSVFVNHLPYQTGELRGLQVSAGCSYRFTSSSLESWRANARYVFSRQTFSFTASDHTFVDHGFQADFNREFSFPGGFLRTGPWVDAAHSEGSSPNARFGGIIRTYLETSPRKPAMMNVDIVASAGSSIGPLPADRAFTGGTRFSDVLLEHPLAAEDYLWMGPLLRGYGASQFHLPTTPNILTTSGTSFAGISFTAGLPGWSKLLFYSSKPEYEKQLHATADELTALTRARALYDYLQIESDPAKAENRAAKRVATTKRVLHSLIDHTKEVSLRPILAYDRATLFSRAQNSVTDWSVGGGVRLWIRGAKAEVLYFRNGGILPEGKSYNLTIKVSMRVGVHPDYVDLK